MTQQYQVPQFITVEDKIIGPLTIKQSLYVGAAGLLILGLYQIFTGFVFYFLAILVGALGASLAFLKINEQPLPRIIKNFLLYLLKPRLYTWKKEPPAKLKTKEEIKKPEVLIKGIPKLSESKLTDLAWSLDIKGSAQKYKR